MLIITEKKRKCFFFYFQRLGYRREETDPWKERLEKGKQERKVSENEAKHLFSQTEPM